jgi:outer membrane protein TolC
MRFVQIGIIILLLPMLSSAQAQLNTLQEVLVYADQHSADARQAELLPQIAKQDVKMQTSYLYPKVNVFGAGDYYPLIPTQLIPAEILGGPKGTYYKAQFGLPYVFQTGAELSIPVVDLEKWAQLQRTRAQYEQAEWSSKTALERLHLQVIQLYYQLLVTREVAKLNDENIETVNELVRIMNDRKEAGILDPSDYNRSLTLKLNTETSDIDYKKNIRQNENSLDALLTVKDNVHVTVGGVLADFNWPVLSQPGAITTRPGWQEADKKVRVSELMLNESKKGGLPKLNLNSKYAYNYQSRFESGVKGVDFQTANIGLRVDVPVFRGNYYRSMQKKSGLQLQSALLDKEKTEATLTQQQNDWFNMYTAAYSKHTVVEQKVKTTSDNLRIAGLNVKEGLMEFDEFNNIFMEYNRAKMEYLQNLTDGVLYYLLSTQKF